MRRSSRRANNHDIVNPVVVPPLDERALWVSAEVSRVVMGEYLRSI